MMNLLWYPIWDKKFRGGYRDYDRPNRNFGQDYEYKRKDEKEDANQSSDYVEKNPKPADTEPKEPEMKEAEPEARSEYPKKKRGSGFGFNSSFGHKHGKFGGQDKWANDKKAYDEEPDTAPNDQHSGDYAYKHKSAYTRPAYKKENLTYYERKTNTESKAEPDYYKGTDFDDLQKETADSKNEAPINWNTQNKKRQDIESDEYEDSGNQRRDGGYNSKYYKKFQSYKSYHDEGKRSDHYSKYRDDEYYEYEEPEKHYKNHNHEYEDDYYNQDKTERYGKYPEKSYKGGQGSKYHDRKYQHEGKSSGYNYNDRQTEEPKPAQNQPPVPERKLGGREFKLPTPDDLKKQEAAEARKKEAAAKAKAAEADEANKQKKPENQNEKPVVWQLLILEQKSWSSTA